MLHVNDMLNYNPFIVTYILNSIHSSGSHPIVTHMQSVKALARCRVVGGGCWGLGGGEGVWWGMVAVTGGMGWIERRERNIAMFYH